MPTVFFKKGLPNSRKDVEFMSALGSILFGGQLIWPGPTLIYAPAFEGLLWYGPEWLTGAAMITGGLVQFLAPSYPPKWRIGAMMASFFYWLFLLLTTITSPEHANPAWVFCLMFAVGSLRCSADLLDRYRA